jgi:hypothetical protein
MRVSACEGSHDVRTQRRQRGSSRQCGRAARYAYAIWGARPARAQARMLDGACPPRPCARPRLAGFGRICPPDRVYIRTREDMVRVRLGGSRARTLGGGKTVVKQQKPAVTVVPSRVGVMGIDAGGTTGVAWWSGELKDGIGETLRDGEFGFTQVDCGNGTPTGEREGAERIAHLFVEQQAEWTLASVPIGDQWLVVEDFVLRQKVGSKQRVGLSSPRVGALLEGMLCRVLDGGNIARYAPSRSKQFATSDRLKQWDLWCRSMPHARDAAKQIALHVAVLLDG